MSTLWVWKDDGNHFGAWSCPDGEGGSNLVVAITREVGP